MSDRNRQLDPGALWRSQPQEEVDMDVRQFMTLRTRDLRSATRTEILTSFAAAIFFIAVVAWRIPQSQGWTMPLAFGAVLLWIFACLYWFRRRIWPPPLSKDALAASCSDYYRCQLEQRRDHLRNEWLWHGPLLFACLICFTAVFRNTFYGYARIGTILPFVGLLVVWVAFGFWRRWRQANELQREIDELDPGRST